MLFKGRVPEENPLIKENEIGFYEKYLNEFREYKAALYKEIADSYQSGILLEVDAGLGYMGINILKINPGLRLMALESRKELSDRSVINAAKEALSQERWHLVSGDSESIPCKDGYFDGVISENALHHWRDPVKVIREMFRVTNEDGCIIISDLRRDADENIAEIMIRDWKGRNTPEAGWFLKHFIGSWRASYVKEEIETIAEKAGAKRIEIAQDGPVTYTIKIINERKGVYN